MIKLWHLSHPWALGKTKDDSTGDKLDTTTTSYDGETSCVKIDTTTSDNGETNGVTVDTADTEGNEGVRPMAATLFQWTCHQLTFSVKVQQKCHQLTRTTTLWITVMTPMA